MSREVVIFFPRSKQRFTSFCFSLKLMLASYRGKLNIFLSVANFGLMRSIARDAGPYGVTSNAVLPGWVRTPMAETSAKAEAEQRGISPDEVWGERAAMYPAGRLVKPEEVAQVIAFLASEESSGVNGEAIAVALGGLE